MKNPNHNQGQNVAANRSRNYVSMDAVPRVERSAPYIRTGSATLNFTLHPSVWLALFIMSLVGLIAVALHYFINRDTSAEYAVAKTQAQLLTSPVSNTSLIQLVSNEKRTKALAITPNKDTEAEKKKFSSNIDIIAKNCARIMTKQKSFAVFEHGTCVLLIEPLDDPVVSARSTLKILSDPNIKFEVRALNNNNYLIIFDKYLFCWLFAHDLAENKEAIMRDKRLARSDADPPSLKALPEVQLRVGKLARLCLIADSQKLNIKKIIRAKQSPANQTQPEKPQSAEHNPDLTIPQSQ